MTNKFNPEFFNDAMKVFIDYVDRQMKKNANYKAHPLIRAFECALSKIDEFKVGERLLGVSQEGTKDSVYNPYAVALEKKENGIEVLEIRNLKINKEVPVDVMVMIFRLQIQLDKIAGDCVSPDQMANMLNDVIPGNKFYALGDRWKEARDAFQKQVETGKVPLPADRKRREELFSGLEKIKYSTPWEDYPSKLRTLIGMSIMDSLEDKRVKMIIVSPKTAKIEKFKVGDMAIEFLMGEVSEFLNQEDKK